MRLCDANTGHVLRAEADTLSTAAMRGPRPVHPDVFAKLALSRDNRGAFKRFKFLTKAARLSSSRLVASFIFSRAGLNRFSAISR